MGKITKIDAANFSIDIFADKSVLPRLRTPGPPVRIDGMTVGVVTMDQNAPHGGEVHPDGDEWLYVISGRLRVVGDSAPDEPMELGPGESCIVSEGEWHRVDVLEPTQLIHVTPGPNGDHRPELEDA